MYKFRPKEDEEEVRSEGERDATKSTPSRSVVEKSGDEIKTSTGTIKEIDGAKRKKKKMRSMHGDEKDEMNIECGCGQHNFFSLLFLFFFACSLASFFRAFSLRRVSICASFSFVIFILSRLLQDLSRELSVVVTSACL